jgi:hypothetical protein
MHHMPPNNWPSKDKWTQFICHMAYSYFATCHILRPYKMHHVEFSRSNKNIFEILKLLPHGNTSFVVKVTKLATW